MNPAFSIATFNLFNFVEPPLAYYDAENIYDATQWQRKCDWTRDRLIEMAPDIIGFQEVFSAAPLAALCEAQGLSHWALAPGPEEQDFIRRKPRVALASRYPIVETATVLPNPELVKALGLAQPFHFSRQPLKVRLHVPGFSDVRVIVVHLKSPRAAWQPGERPLIADEELDQRVATPVLGRWASALQRSAEAAMLCLDLMNDQLLDPLPSVILGDFNGDLGSDLLTLLQGGEEDAYRLQDAHDLALYQGDRDPTHYWGANGSVLDHILLSAQFNAGFGQSLAQVDEVVVWDRHLRFNDAEQDRMASDHAPVLARISVRI
ncbi:endonuclease/exonuclease/phosphatase family protein [Ferrimonas balearica]|uniref:endonuclease/exonuclease/phosphatase family protein n=1 Tax=Ferrimonas balearica TaxID=44012 RepID=UPI001C575E91|nr:endonuclease/exonuclease/phosphatase family protein [Ferrimonas balearica]MBW3163636.1 endonuclease/exonuclease/phosphatase family protein [Ferrimonas balearica]